MQLRNGTVYQFDPFAVDSSSGELLKNGFRVKLQDQPYRLLVALLENPGGVVSREDLRNRLWQDDTFVDFENGLRVAVRKLREALGDDAENPRYIETIPKRGYRFLVTEVRKVNTAHESADLTARPMAAEAGALQEHKLTAKTAWSRFHKWALLGALPLFIVVTAATLVFLFRPKKMTALTGKDSLVLADFANSTGDPVFGGTLRQGLATIPCSDDCVRVLVLLARPIDGRSTLLSNPNRTELASRSSSRVRIETRWRATKPRTTTKALRRQKQRTNP
jgi:DNA-binding winged helix-turn-helix (wHTH) protein